jgi:DNA-binding transcriptional MerR regulator
MFRPDFPQRIRVVNISSRETAIDFPRVGPKMFQTLVLFFVLATFWGEMQEEFSSNDVIALTGITARQLQWWDERGIVAPRHERHRRIYNWDELVTVAVICQLRRRGFSLQRVRKVIRFLQQEFGTDLAATVSASSEYHLLTDGTHLFLRTSARAVVDLLKNSRQPLLDICLSDEVRRVRTEINALKKNAIPEREARRDRAQGRIRQLRRVRSA